MKSSLSVFLAVLAVSSLAGCAYHIYSPTAHAREIADRSDVASGLQARADRIERQNDVLRAKEYKLRNKLQTVQDEIRRLRSVPEPDTSATQGRLHALLDEQATLQENLASVRSEIAQKNDERSKILHADLR